MPLKPPQPSFEAIFTKNGAKGAASNGSAGTFLPWLRRAFPKYTLAEVILFS